MSECNELVPVSTADAPTPAGHYQQAVVHGGTVYVSGQLPIRPNGERVTASIEEQTQQVLENIAAIVRAAGSHEKRILKMTLYVADIAEWGQINQVYSKFFGEHRPARAIVPTRELHHGFKLEADAIAAQ